MESGAQSIPTPLIPLAKGGSGMGGGRWRVAGRPNEAVRCARLPPCPRSPAQEYGRKVTEPNDSVRPPWCREPAPGIRGPLLFVHDSA